MSLAHMGCHPRVQSTSGSPKIVIPLELNVVCLVWFLGRVDHGEKGTSPSRSPIGVRRRTVSGPLLDPPKIPRKKMGETHGIPDYPKNISKFGFSKKIKEFLV